MPVPWGNSSGKGHVPVVFPERRIEAAEDRAMSLRQLHDLRAFCQRLCKAGLLKYPDTKHNQREGRVGKRVKWTQLTQHEICQLLIKKIIPENGSCSWVDLVSHGSAQKCDFFCSHNWGEYFRDFMASIDAQARAKGVGLETYYWICVYANNQHNVELGETLKESPFYKALVSAKGTILLLDKAAEALLRLWCVFEMHETLKNSKTKRLEIWTPLGRVGSGLVSSGPVVQALNRIDTRCAEATNAVDQRQILNHIAGVKETQGIHFYPDGSKQLKEDGHSSDGHSLEETVYEEALRTTYRENFKTLNEAIIELVTRALNDAEGPQRQRELRSINEVSGDGRRPSNSATSNEAHHYQKLMKKKCNIPEGSLRGVTLQQLRDFHQQVKYDFERGLLIPDKEKPKMRDYDTADVYDLERVYLEPQRRHASCSYVELIAEDAQRPEWHVIYGSKITFKDFMAAIEWHAEARQLPDSTVYYVVPFMIDTKESNRPTEEKFNMKRGPPTKEVLENHCIGVLMLIDMSASVLERSIPAWEAHLGIRKGLCFDLAAASGALATTRPFENGVWEFGDFDAEVARKALTFDVAKTEAKDDDIRLKYLGEIAFGPGKEVKEIPPADKNFSFTRLNTRLRQKLAGPVLREAGYCGSIEMVQEVLRACPNMSFSCESLRGIMGETAMHTAAASGRTDVLKLLLILKAFVDPQDIMGETPLHYAAFTGQADAVRLLLKMTASPEEESYDAETPLKVATLNAAYFLDVDTKDVTEILTKAMEEAMETHERNFTNAEAEGPAILFNRIDVLRVENWKLRTEVAAAHAKVSRLEAENKQQAQRLQKLPSTFTEVIVKVKQAFLDRGIRYIAPVHLHQLLSQLSGMDMVDCKLLVDAAPDTLHGDGQLDCGRFLDWLADTCDARNL